MCLPSKERAAARQRAAAVAAGRTLVEKFPTPNKDERAPSEEYQAIRKAVNDEQAMRVLCERWAGNLHAIQFYERRRGSTGCEVGNQNALSSACQVGNEATVRLLLSAGADVNAFNGLFSSLEYAIMGCHLPIIRLLIDEGADVNHLLMGISTPLDMITRKIEEYTCKKYNDDTGKEEGPLPVPEDLLAIAELIKRAGGHRGGLLFSLCCWHFCL